MQLALEKKNGEIIGALSRRIKRLCWEYANLYYAYMTLSKNYYVYENDMYMCTINNYLSLFKILKSLHESPWLNKILISETQSVVDDIKRYVDFEECSDSAVLVDHPGYLSAIHECGYYWISIIDNEAENFQLRAEEILKRNHDADASVQQFSQDFSDSFDRYLQIAEYYQGITEKLCQTLRNDLANEYLLDTPEWDEANKKLIEFSDRKLALHKAVAAFVVGIFRKLSGLQGTNRLSLLKGTNNLRKVFCGIVNYRDKTATKPLQNFNSEQGTNGYAATSFSPATQESAALPSGTQYTSGQKSQNTSQSFSSWNPTSVPSSGSKPNRADEVSADEVAYLDANTADTRMLHMARDSSGKSILAQQAAYNSPFSNQQDTGGTFAPDGWKPTQISQGTVLYQLGEKGGTKSSYFTDQGTVQSCINPKTGKVDISLLKEKLQITDPSNQKDTLVAYLVTDSGGVFAAEGHAKENPQYGSGGGRQYFVINANAMKGSGGVLQQIDISDVRLYSMQ